MGVFDDLVGSSSGGSKGGGRPVKDRKQGTQGKRAGGRADLSIMDDSCGSSAALVGDTVTAAGVPADGLPVSVDDVREMVGGWLSAWCECNDVQDMRKASPLIFRSCCSDIGRLYIKPSRILKSTVRKAGGVCSDTTCNAYDPVAVVALFDVFVALCGRYDKIPFQSTFAAFSGVSLSYVREYTQELTAMGLDIAKRTHTAEIDAIRQKSGNDPVGRLAILNNEYWSGAGSVASDAGSAAAALPSAGSFGLIGGAGID